MLGDRNRIGIKLGGIARDSEIRIWTDVHERILVESWTNVPKRKCKIKVEEKINSLCFFFNQLI